MKNVFLLLALIFSLTAYRAEAALLGAPFMPEIDSRFDAVEGASTVNAMNGLHQKQVAVATWDFAKHGGDVGTINLGVSLPAAAIITRSFIRVNTPVTGSGTLAFQCEDANNLFSAAAVASYHVGNVAEGTATGASTVFGDVASQCNISAVIASSALTAGKVSVFVEYFVHP